MPGRRKREGPPDTAQAHEPGIARVYYAGVFGTQDAKYRWLDGRERATTKWSRLTPRAPSYLFIPYDGVREKAYKRFPSVPDILPVNSVGIVTARDNLTIHWTAEEAWKTVTVFARMEPRLARQAHGLGKDSQDWKVRLAQKDLLHSGPKRGNVVPILYRPFDVRHTYYTGRAAGFMCRPRPDVMRHMLAGSSLCLMTCRQQSRPGVWNLAGVGDVLVESCALSNVTKEIAYAFPLHLYPDAGRVPSGREGSRQPRERRPNLNPAVVAALTEAHGREPTPEDVFHYVYAVLHAPAYRGKYAEFLRADFPRVPFTADVRLFRRLAALGARLAALHLLESPELDTPSCRFEGKGDSLVGRGRRDGLRYEVRGTSVHVNASQFFAPVPEAVWSYRIGGYQVAEKWLRDRRERRLTADEVRTYCRIVTALGVTIGIQKKIDALYPDVEKEIVTMPGGDE